MNKEGELTAQQLMAIEFLAEGMSKTKVAEVVACTRQTIHNWLNDETFSEALTTAIIETENARRVERIQKAKKIAGTALEELESRLNSQEKREKINAKDLVTIYKDVVATAAKEAELVKPGDKAKDPDDNTSVEVVGSKEEDMKDPKFRKGLLKLMRERE